MTDETGVPLKQRHGCLTAYLISMLIANSATALIITGTIITHAQTIHWALPIVAIAGFFNLACAIAILKWKKWGFWGFCVSAIIVFVANMSIGTPLGSSIAGLLGFAVLYGVLQIGRDNKGWPQLD